MKIQCGHCQNLMTVGPELVGQQVSCPHCQTILIVPGGRPAPASSSQSIPRGPSPTSLPPKKGMNGCLKAFLNGLAVLIVLVIVGYYFWSQDNKLRQYGIARIEAMPISGNEKLMYRALANHYHLNAANSGPRVSKRSTGTPSEDEYWEALKALIDGDLAKLREQPKYSEIAGATYLWREDRSNYLLKLDANGSYEKTMYWDADKKFSDPVESEKGVWKAESGTFQWTPATGTPTTQEIIRLGREGIVLKIDGNTASYWKRYR